MSIKNILATKSPGSAWGTFYTDPSDFVSVEDDSNIKGIEERMSKIEKDYIKCKMIE